MKKTIGILALTVSIAFGAAAQQTSPSEENLDIKEMSIKEMMAHKKEQRRKDTRQKLDFFKKSFKSGHVMVATHNIQDGLGHTIPTPPIVHYVAIDEQTVLTEPSTATINNGLFGISVDKQVISYEVDKAGKNPPSVTFNIDSISGDDMQVNVNGLGVTKVMLNDDSSKRFLLLSPIVAIL